MSVQLALSSAASGLRSAQQQAAVASHNIANATTPGYVGRSAELTSAALAGRGAGVRVSAITRGVDELLIRDARHAQSLYAAQEARASALADYALVLGQPQDERSVSTRLSQLRQAFDRLYDMPNDAAAQNAVVAGASALVGSLHAAADTARAVQTDARDRLADAIGVVNAALHRVSELNGAIASLDARGGDTGDLRDERDRLIDRISDEIGIRTYSRDDGQVVVMTRNGQTLLDRPLTPGETPLTLVGTTLAVNGTAIAGGVPPADHATEIQSGRIMGYVQTAYQDMPRALAQLDELAGGIAGLFQAAESGPGTGLFGYTGTPDPATPGDRVSRLQVNDIVLTEPWRVQSGVTAAAPLEPGDRTQIAAYVNVFRTSIAYTAPDLPSSATIGDFATALVSVQHGYRTTAEAEMSSRRIGADALQNARINRDGVNLDDEMQKLLLIEQSYGASAQVIQVAARMLDILLQIKA
ncbi:flagellar hook-associated protein FlgK [Azospirillum halopraeferens]|uniref:flagellar hook-associated protein FlgK n=1 Tax=Azospirillum halopraeferens TaxID=34010 RepID=UPI000421A9C2|nr:flagellar hook-associated protein FlgK [Azospirillum halopraeferens]